jgi:isopentenyl phosphate kinase
MTKKETLPLWSKGVIAVVVTGAVGFGVYKLYKYIKDKQDQERQREELSETDRKLKELKQQGKGPTLSGPQIIQLANKFETAFLGYGTDFGAIKNIVNQIKNDSDILSIRKAYDIRTISSGSYNFATDFKGTLDQTITDELDSSQIAELNTILVNKNITDIF